MMARINADTPKVPSARPPKSSECAPGLLDSGTTKVDATNAMITTGRFTRNIEPYQKWTKSEPPTIGPTAMATPAVAPQIPNALARSESSSNVVVKIDSV